MFKMQGTVKAIELKLKKIWKSQIQHELGPKLGLYSSPRVLLASYSRSCNPWSTLMWLLWFIGYFHLLQMQHNSYSVVQTLFQLFFQPSRSSFPNIVLRIPKNECSLVFTIPIIFIPLFIISLLLSFLKILRHHY